MVSYQWRGAFANAEVNELHAEAFGDDLGKYDWKALLERYSLGWACARQGDALAGFLNVPWDGGSHAFLVDTMVASALRRQGIGAGLVDLAVQQARAAGCEWLHVDFEDHLRPFYLGRCGFQPTTAGLIRLRPA